MLRADKDRLVQWGPRPAVDMVLDRKLGHDRPARRNDNCPHTRRGAILINKLKFTSSQALGQLTELGLFVCLIVYPRMVFSSLTVRNRWARRTGDRSSQALCPCPMKSQTLIRTRGGARGTRLTQACLMATVSFTDQDLSQQTTQIAGRPPACHLTIPVAVALTPGPPTP